MSTTTSWQLGAVPPAADDARVETIADGIAVRVPVATAVNDLRGLVDDVLLVDDAQLLCAMRWIHQDTGLIVEPSAATGVAAIASHPLRFARRRVATVLTGSNLTRDQVAAWLG